MTKILILCATLALLSPDACGAPADVTVYFSPRGGATDAAVTAIREAKQTIDFQAYCFTSIPILTALQSAAARGVRVRAVYDRGNRVAKRTLADELAKFPTGPQLRFSPAALMHTKALIIDSKRVLCGSFNWTAGAEVSNNECLVIIDSPEVAEKFRREFERILATSRP